MHTSSMIRSLLTTKNALLRPAPQVLEVRREWNQCTIMEPRKTHNIETFCIICLTKTWSNRTKPDLKGFSNPFHLFRNVQNKRDKRSSDGIIIYISDQIQNDVTEINKRIGSLIWIKTRKNVSFK